MWHTLRDDNVARGANKSTIRERLLELEGLRNENLITDEEYRTRRDEILRET